jgi:hypothetical protein
MFESFFKMHVWWACGPGIHPHVADAQHVLISLPCSALMLAVASYLIAKVAIDQGLQAPIVLALIITGLAFMEGRGIGGIRQDMGNAYIYSLIQNCEFLAFMY